MMVHLHAIVVTFLLGIIECGATTVMRIHVPDCPSRCTCEKDAILLRVDCAYLGLTGLPANLSILTSYLDLSMNNLTTLPASALSNLHFLQELRLAGNGLTHIAKGAFSGLASLKVLMLQNNRLTQIPSKALQSLRNLHSLRLDANHFSTVPPGCFEGLASLRHLWLDDNSLTEVPVQALGSLVALQAVTLALNRISHIPDRAFANLSSLVVLHLHNNRIRSLGKRCFDGLQSLETLDLNYNNLDEFPMAIRDLGNLKELGFQSNNIRSIPEDVFTGNPSLLTIFFYNNPIQFVGKSAFQHLPELRTLSLYGATEMTEFPDLTGTQSLESLTITGARITSLPSAICEQLPNLHVLDLSYNLIHHLPSFSGCKKIQKMDLAWNKLRSVDPLAFSNLRSLIKLDLTSNMLSSLPVMGLRGLTHLRLGGNVGLQELLSTESLPKLRVMEMPYAFQCCAFVSCEKSYPSVTKETSNNSYRRKETSLISSHEDHDLEDFLLEFDEDPKSHHSIQCFPAPGPFQPCDQLFGSWLVRSGVWTIVVVCLVCNTLVGITVFLSPAFQAPAKQLVGLLASANLLTGLSSCALALVDTATLGSFARYGAWWESGAGCRITAFLSVLSSEAAIFLLTTATLSLRCFKKLPVSVGNARLASALCFLLAFAIALLPLLHVGGEYAISPLCLPLPFAEPASLGFTVALVLLNSLCYVIMAATYAKLCCDLGRGWPDDCWDCSLTKHVGRLLFTDCLLFFPVAFLSFSSLRSFSFVSAEVAKSILLLVVPLPACLNPLLYMLLNPHFREDLRWLLEQTRLRKGNRCTSSVSVNSDDAEKQSCCSTQALVTTTCPYECEGAWPSQQGLMPVVQQRLFSRC